MKKQVKEQVLAFMQSIETSEMNSNQFIIQFTEYINGYVGSYDTLEDLLNGPSVESITRARRYVVKAHGIGVRVKADKEKDYIDEYCLENKF